MNPISLLKAVTAHDSAHRNSLFQVTWATLHLIVTVLSFGSFIYHARRIHYQAPEEKPGS